jgi:hypothetical protein
VPYKTFATNDVLTAADVNAMHADAVQASAGLGLVETTTSTGYTDLATTGPTASMSLVQGQQMRIMIQCRIKNVAGGAGFEARMGFAVTGAGSLGANDTRAIKCQSSQHVPGFFEYWYTAPATGNYTVTAKYSVSASTGEFNDRYLSLKKF